MGRIPLAIAIALTGLAVAAPVAPATIYPVTTTADGADDGECVTDCSLREAVGRANVATDPDVIQLPPGDYELTFNTQLDLTKPVDIVGVSGVAARNTTVRGNDTGTAGDRIFQVRDDTTLSGFTITAGKGKGGGNITFGGGIYQSGGDLVLRNMRVAANVINNGDFANGGGIYHGGTAGTLTIENSLITANSAVGPGGTDTGAGGGIYVAGNGGAVTITNTTIHDNLASGPMQSGGGGINAAGPSVTTLHNVSLTSNTVAGPSTFGGNLAHAATVIARNTVVADGTAPLAPNCFVAGTQTSQGGNLENGTSCGFTEPTDKNAAPALLAMADNGGPTDTRAFATASPLFEAGQATGCPATDQRGIPRPQGTGCDIGAFELEVAVPPVPGPGPSPAPRPEPDVTAAAFTDLRLAPAAFPAGPSGPSARAAARRGRVYGTRVSYRLDEAATTTFTVEKRVVGRRVGRRCVRLTRANRKRPRCARYVKLAGSFVRAGKLGVNRFRFTGRLRGRKLAPGSYRLLAAAKDTAGNRSKVVRRAFRVVY